MTVSSVEVTTSRVRLTLTVRILIGLVLGLAAGIALGLARPSWGPGLLAVVQPVGQIWLRALQMTIVPLVFALLVTGIASVAGRAATGGVPARAILVFAAGLIGSALLSAFVTTLLLDIAPPSPAAAAALRAGAGGDLPPMPPLSEWLVTFVPDNPVAAAAQTQMVGLVIFALVFGLAVARLAEAPRLRLVELFDAIVQAMLMIVHWVLLAGPVGVFVLAIGVGAGAGVAAAGALVHYVAIVISVMLVLLAATYAAAVAFGRIAPARFARGVLAAQVVGVSTQSSIATLPAMLAATDAIGVRPAVRDTVLPMAVSLFRITSPCANLSVVIYLAWLYGVPLGAGSLVLGALVAALVSLAAVGLPGQVSFFTTIGPICLALGVPMAVLPLLLAVESLPDIFRTIGNVTGDLAATRIVEVRTPTEED
jgi:Na+/H+-dicarboxylate symporter